MRLTEPAEFVEVSRNKALTMRNRKDIKSIQPERSVVVLGCLNRLTGKLKSVSECVVCKNGRNVHFLAFKNGKTNQMKLIKQTVVAKASL